MHDYNACMSIEIPIARRDLIQQRLAQGQAVVASALAAEFGVSEDAIRRDLRALAAEGRCRRVYGGALPLHPASKPMAARMGEDGARKDALARMAVQTIQAGEFIFLDAGSTNLAMVEHLPEDWGLTIASNSIDIAMAVQQRGDLPLLMVGGSVDPESGACLDAAALQAVAAMNIDRCFIGACALSARAGLGAIHHADALFKRAVLAASQTSVALVATEKLMAKVPHRVAWAKDLGQIVVEADAPQNVLEELSQAGARLLQAPAPTTA